MEEPISDDATGFSEENNGLDVGIREALREYLQEQADYSEQNYYGDL